MRWRHVGEPTWRSGTCQRRSACSKVIGLLWQWAELRNGGCPRGSECCSAAKEVVGCHAVGCVCCGEPACCGAAGGVSGSVSSCVIHHASFAIPDSSPRCVSVCRVCYAEATKNCYLYSVVPEVLFRPLWRQASKTFFTEFRDLASLLWHEALQKPRSEDGARSGSSAQGPPSMCIRVGAKRSGLKGLRSSGAIWSLPTAPRTEEML